jgi:phosphatidylglycerol:prolipoprotein diacylglycerol transferase
VLAVISYPPIPIFDLGPLRLSLHGLFAAVGFLAGAMIATRYLGRRGFDTVKYQSVLTWALVGSILGARWFTLPATFASNGFDISQFVNLSGNYSIMGGFAGGILAGAFRMRKVGLPVLPTLDVSTFGLAVGTIVGRIGDLAIVEHLGGPTTFALGYGVKPGYDLAPQHNVLECTVALTPDGLCGIYHHSAAYDMAGAIVLFGVLFWIYNRSGWKLRYGQMFFGWIVWYGLQRFLIDFTRLALDQGGDATLGPLTWSQWSAVVAAAIAAVVVVWLARRGDVVSPEADAARGADTGEHDHDRSAALES